MVRKTTILILLCILWWIEIQGQQQLTLHQCLQYARKNNPDLKVLKENVNIAEADKVTARLHLNPLFNLQTLHLANSNYYQEGTIWANGVNNQYWYQLTKPIAISGQRINRIRLASQLISQSQIDFYEASRNIYFEIASKWIDVWAANINLEILMKGKINIDSLVHINELRHEEEMVTLTDLLRTQLLQQQYQRDITSSYQNLLNEQRNLSYRIGIADSWNIVFNDSLFVFSVSLDSLLESSMRKRSDILSARNNIQVANLNMTLQQSYAYPVPEIGGIFNPQNKIPYIGLYGTIEVPIFERNQGERQKARILKYQAEKNLFAIQLQAETEISNAYKTYNTQLKNLAEYERSLTKAEEILSNVRYSYLRGATSIIDLLEAERSWLDTQQRYYATKESLIRSYIQLLFVTGSINEYAE